MPRPNSYMQPEDLTDFGRYLEACCKILGISHRRLAREAGIPQPTLATWVADGHRPALASLQKVFAACRKYELWRVEPWERDLTNLANHVTQQQKDAALHDLLVLEQEVQNPGRPPASDV